MVGGNGMKSKNRINPDLRRMIVGAITGITAFLVNSLLAAFILTKKDLSYPVVRYVVAAAAAFSAFLAGFAAKRKNHIKGFICGLSGGIAVLIAVMLLLVSFNGIKMAGESLLLIPIVLFCGAAGGIISSNMR